MVDETQHIIINVVMKDTYTQSFHYSQTPKAQEKQKVSTLEIHNEIPSPTFYAKII